MEIEVALDAGATIGESPTWAPAENALYWIDVKKPALYRYEPVTGGQQSWPMSSDIGAFALVSDPPGAVVALRQGIFRLDFASGSLTQLAPPPFDPTLFRFNEGACDAAGRFWVGVMFDPVRNTCGSNPTDTPVRKCLRHQARADRGRARVAPAADRCRAAGHNQEHSVPAPKSCSAPKCAAHRMSFWAASKTV
jgi:sugar lactone lactonase YvrE